MRGRSGTRLVTVRAPGNEEGGETFFLVMTVTVSGPVLVKVSNTLHTESSYDAIKM
jgi:hypothetical protein